MLYGGAPAEYFVGVVESVQGTNPGPASGISYTVKVSAGGGVASIPGIKPTSRRLPDTFDTVAAPPGTPVEIVSVSGILKVSIDEFFDTTTC